MASKDIQILSLSGIIGLDIFLSHESLTLLGIALGLEAIALISYLRLRYSSRSNYSHYPKEKPKH